MDLWPGPERLKAVQAPRSDVGAPLPHIRADDCHLAFAYRLNSPDPDWDGTSIRIVTPDDEDLCAIVTAEHFHGVRFGPPNDEALGGHPLHRLGLRAYSSFEVENSSWIADMETANRVHPYHEADAYRLRRHFIFTFHDTTLEFVARGFVADTRRGLIRRLLLDAFAVD